MVDDLPKARTCCNRGLCPHYYCCHGDRTSTVSTLLIPLSLVQATYATTVSGWLRRNVNFPRIAYLPAIQAHVHKQKWVESNPLQVINDIAVTASFPYASGREGVVVLSLLLVIRIRRLACTVQPPPRPPSAHGSPMTCNLVGGFYPSPTLNLASWLARSILQRKVGSRRLVAGATKKWHFCCIFFVPMMMRSRGPRVPSPIRR